MFRIGHGYDVHALGEGLPLVLGGVRIDHTHGCIAHSDGDVLLHAICDALLGAAALGDIGRHFPDVSPEYKGVDSALLLACVADMVAGQGYSIVNIDATIAAQRPKLSGYIEQMRSRIAAAAGLDAGQVSVKATTTERLGFVGREEGIAAEAVALIAKA
ncbi:MAG: 2-C-methyl-D-erythritol 2,4-cyclodiphosphate synthase [Rikenellaceae bacterium]|jgi:2-C-methyl-D-erythritol 2,4-cyclodiphosphate synthase|nr:2-C-methyl-D-erythritol 2,4-cyclodiphosphate synthase [Rikenellaceae bacterium]